MSSKIALASSTCVLHPRRFGAAAEIILTNEVAIAALIVTVAALRKG